MPEHDALPHLREVLLFLALAGILIPLLGRLRINSVLGFLAVGTLVGPFGLGHFAEDLPTLAYLTFADRAGVATLAEVGVMFLMFMIGLELSAERLWAMRRWVFAAGGAQVLISAFVIGGLAAAFGNSRETAVVLGLVLSFSSTAVVIQLLSERREMATPVGRASFAVLLFQDLAVVPALILVGILGEPHGGSFITTLGSAVGKAVVAIAVIYLLGQRVLRPLFRHFAANRRADTFMALTLLCTLGIAALTAVAGLSMALGAFLAGLLLAETEFRHEIEVAIEPFRGLLMGVFFMSVGMGIDPLAIVREPFWLPASVVGLFLIKATVTAGVLRVSGLPTARSVEAGLLLGQGGEFAFIVIGSALALRLLPAETGQFMMLVVGLSMFVTPFAARIGGTLGRGIASPHSGGDADFGDLPQLDGHVLIAGFGRVGQLLAQVLERHRLAYLAVDPDTQLVGRLHAAGMRVFVGDASRVDLMRRLNVSSALAVVLTMDQSAAALRATRALHEEFPALRIFARARDEAHARALREAGASAVIPETMESSLQLAAFVLGRAGMADDAVALALAREREHRLGEFRAPG